MESAPPLEEENVIRSPDLPYVSSIPGDLFPGRAIVLKGMVLNPGLTDSSRFHVDLCCGLLVQGDHMDNKALHFNPRFETGGGWFSGRPDNNIVINSLINNKWGSEERYPNEFKEGSPFQIRILVLEGYFKIAVNGSHLCDYSHKVPIENVKTVYVGGNIRLDYIEFQPAIATGPDGTPRVVEHTRIDTKVLATLNKPTIPVHHKLENGFVQPQTLQITLTPFLSGERFTINLMHDSEWYFHFRVDMPNHNQKAAIVRNSTHNGGKWLTEERNIVEFPFTKGVTCDVLFTAFTNSVAVDVNGVPFVKFNYRPGQNSRDISIFSIMGDVLVHRIVHKG